jgi:hypothetical protein
MKPIIFSALLVLSMAAHAQSDSTRNRPAFKLSLNYHSNLHYYGRTDSLRSTGFFPLAEFCITPKFYINAAPIFISNKAQSFAYAGTVSTIGFQSITPKWISGIYVLKPFYTKDAQLVQSALQAQAGASLTRLHQVLNVTIGADAKLSNAVDFGASAGVDHIVRIAAPGGGVFVLDPAIAVNAGTQQFSTTYVKNQGGNSFPIPLPGTTNSSSTETKSDKRFTVLSYEFSMPLIYARQHWMLLLTPAYVLPQNLVAGEHGENMFYVTAGLKYSF